MLTTFSRQGTPSYLLSRRKREGEKKGGGERKDGGEEGTLRILRGGREN